MAAHVPSANNPVVSGSMDKPTNPFSGLTPQQVDAVFHIAGGASNPEAADAVGVDRATIWRWRRLEHFQAALNAVQLETLDELKRGWIARVPKALKVIDELLESDNESVRFRVAKDVLNRAGETEFEYETLASILRADAQRIYPDGNEELDKLLAELVHSTNDVPLTEEDRIRRDYLLKRMRELGASDD